MRTKLSTRGQVVLPVRVRRTLGLQAGDTLDTNVESGRIILTPRSGRPPRARIVKDPLTGLPALTAGPHAPRLTHRQVQQILADFP
ncbi:MAG: AbrB/MazE/SpoVT family DNA-binding domain-containing protein [Terriglobia bacterium]